jgi:hypothetical protein
MLHSDESRVGAAFLSKRATANPRELLISLIEQNPDASKDHLFKLFRDEIRDEDEYQRAVDWYFFVNMYEYEVTRRSKRTPEAAVKSAERQREMRQTVESIKSQIMLLNLEMPNGKRMRYCTGAEMAKFGKAYERIAKKVGNTKMVGSVLDEKQVRGLMG